MSELSRFVSGLLAFLSSSAVASVSTAASQIAEAGPSVSDSSDDGAYTRAIRLRNNLQEGVGWTLAQHRSHSSHRSHRSHSSHRSHYSSSRGGAYYPSTPVAPPPASTPPPASSQPPQSLYSPPATPPPTADPAEAEVAKLMMRIQLALNSHGYCNCRIDGKFGPTTEKALRDFQRDKGLKVTGLPNKETLEKLGVSFNL